MVVSRDWQEVSVLECILGGLQMDVAVENEPQRALARLAKSKIDALIVDCDLNGSSQFLRELQSVESTARTFLWSSWAARNADQTLTRLARCLPSRNRFPWNRPCALSPRRAT